MHAYGFNNPLSKQEKRVWRAVHRLLEKESGREICLPTWFSKVADGVFKGDLRVRRYYPAFVEACKTIALIRSFQRPDGHAQANRLTVDFIDYALATLILEDIYVESLHRDEGPAADTRQIVARIYASKGGKPVSATDLVKELHPLSRDRAYDMLRDAEDAGTIVRANEPEKNNSKFFLPSPRPRFVPDPEQLHAVLSDKDVPPHVSFLHPITGELVTYTRPAKTKSQR